MDNKKLTEAVLAVVPSGTTGVLLLKTSGDLTAEEGTHVSVCVNQAIRRAGLRYTVLVTDFDFTLRLLTDKALRDIGLQRICSEVV